MRLVVGVTARRGFLGIVAAIMLAAVVPPSDADASRLVGQAAGSRAFVGVVSDGQGLVAYVCDGRRISQWFRGTVEDGAASVRNAAGVSLTIRFARGRATGSVRFRDRKSLRFAVVPARGRAGLFRRAEARFGPGAAEPRLTGWIRLNDGRVRGLTQKTVSSTTVLIAPGSAPPATALVATTDLLPDCSLPAPSLVRPLRITLPALPLCRLDLPPRVPPTTSTRVLALPTVARIGAQEAAQLPAYALAQLEQRLRQSGILPLLPPDLESAFLLYESALRDNAALKDAGARLADALRARDAPGVRSRLAEIQSMLAKASIPIPDTTTSRLAAGKSLSFLSVAPNRALRPLTSRVVLRGPDFVAVSRTERENNLLLSASAGADLSAGVDLVARVAGQSVTATTKASTVFDVPANVAEVELKTIGWNVYGFANYTCNFGWAAAYWSVAAWASKAVTASEARPSPLTSSGFGESTGEVCPLIPAAPIPNPRRFDGPDPELTLRFRPEPAGGRYQVFFYAYAAGSGAGLTFSTAEAAAQFDRVEITFER